jgi:hypothetical protein
MPFTRLVSVLILALFLCTLYRTASAERIGINVNGFLYGPGVGALKALVKSSKDSHEDSNDWIGVATKVGALSASEIGVIRVPVDFDLLFLGELDIGKVLERIRMLATKTRDSQAPIYISPVMQGRGEVIRSHVVRFQDEGFREKFGGLLHQLGAGLLAIDRNRFLLEILNEPEYCADAEGLWGELQLNFYRRLRENLPELKIVLSGSCWSQLDTLLRLDLRPYAKDRRTHFTFHYYDPKVFTFQNQPWSKFYFRYTDGIALFPKCNAQSGPRQEVLYAIQNDGRMTPEEKGKLIQDFEKNFANLTSVPWEDHVRRRFAAIRDKALGLGIEPNRIFLGEFGVYKGVTKYPALILDRLYWVQVVKNHAVANGFEWAYWSSVGVGFGIWDSWGMMTADMPLVQVLAGRKEVKRRACEN